jgi:hypothetical protein
MVFEGYNKEYSVEDVFYVESGKRITEQEVYQHLGNIPVVTSKTSEKGISWYADEEWLKRNGRIYDGKLITWTKEGYAGKLFLRDYSFFPIDVCGVLMLRDDFKDKVNLNWFIFTQQENFYKNVYSKGSQGKLYQESVKGIKFNLLDRKTQDELSKKYQEIIILRNKINKIISQIQKTLNKSFSFSKENINEISANNLFEKISGNSGLTEEYIYSLVQEKIRNIDFIGGSIKADFIKIPFCNHPKKDNSKINILENRDGILVVRKGKAGLIRYLKKGKYATNDDAYMLYLSEGYKDKVNLKWVYYTHKEVFLEYSSSSDNGTWNMTNFMENAIFKIPSIDEQNKIVELYEELEENKVEVVKIKQSISALFNKEIAFS